MDTKLNLELLKVQTCYTQHRFIALFGFKHSEYRNIVFEAAWKMRFFRVISHPELLSLFLFLE